MVMPTTRSAARGWFTIMSRRCRARTVLARRATSVKASVSSIATAATARRARAARRGRRRPPAPALSASSLRVLVSRVPSREAISVPAPTETCCQEPANARRARRAPTRRGTPRRCRTPLRRRSPARGVRAGAPPGRRRRWPVRRADGDEERGDGHHRDGQRHAGLAAAPVGVAAEQRRADRAHHEADGEHRERGEQVGGRVALREELRREDRREGRVDGPVDPFDGVADRAGDDGPALLAGHAYGPRACGGCRCHSGGPLTRVLEAQWPGGGGPRAGAPRGAPCGRGRRPGRGWRTTRRR